MIEYSNVMTMLSVILAEYQSESVVKMFAADACRQITATLSEQLFTSRYFRQLSALIKNSHIAI